MKIMRYLITILIAAVWLINGLFCKLLNLVPRHQEIVARILGIEHAALLTKFIGSGEIILAFIIITGFRSKAVAILQVILIAAMNVIEIILTPDLLLFGKFNGIIALAFIFLILSNEFYLNREKKLSYEINA